MRTIHNVCTTSVRIDSSRFIVQHCSALRLPFSLAAVHPLPCPCSPLPALFSTSHTFLRVCRPRCGSSQLHHGSKCAAYCWIRTSPGLTKAACCGSAAGLKTQ